MAVGQNCMRLRPRHPSFSVDRVREFARIGRSGPISRRLARRLVRALPIRGVDKLAFLVIGKPRCRRQLVTVRRDSVAYRLDLAKDLHRLIYLGLNEQAAKAEITPRINGNELVVDVGANCGFWTLAAASAGARVIAFEPVLDNAALCRENLKLNSLEGRVTLFETAVSDRAGVAEIFVDASENAGEEASMHRQNGGRALRVETVTLDEALGDRDEPLVLLKIDVEGHEMSVLRGAEGVFSRGLPRYVLIEMVDEFLRSAGSSAAEVANWLARHGYVPARWFPLKGYEFHPRHKPRPLPLPPPPSMAGLVLWRAASAP